MTQGADHGPNLAYGVPLRNRQKWQKYTESRTASVPRPQWDLNTVSHVNSALATLRR